MTYKKKKKTKKTETSKIEISKKSCSHFMLTTLNQKKIQIVLKLWFKSDFEYKTTKNAFTGNMVENRSDLYFLYVPSNIKNHLISPNFDRNFSNFRAVSLRCIIIIIYNDHFFFTGRTFGMKRIQFMLMPMMYKMGVMTTLLVVLTVISLKGLMIGE